LAWTTPPTFVAGASLTAAQLNTTALGTGTWQLALPVAARRLGQVFIGGAIDVSAGGQAIPIAGEQVSVLAPPAAAVAGHGRRRLPGRQQHPADRHAGHW
jgi:hypothetical protein